MPQLPLERRDPRSRPARRPAEHPRPCCRPSASSEWIRDALRRRPARDRGRLVRAGAACCRSSPTRAELVAFAKTLPGLFVSVLVPNLKGAERAHRRRGRPAARAAVGEPCAQPRQPAQDARRGGRRGRPDPRRARRRRLEDADRRRHRHRLRLHDPGRGRSRPRCCAACRRCSTPAPTASASPTPSATPTRRAVRDAVRAGAAASPASASGAATSTTRAASRSPTSTPRCETGVARFDASLAGIGGCPHAPGASGNASSEDLAFMLASMGIDDRHRHRRAARAARQGRRLARAARRCTARSGAPACRRPSLATATPVAA